MRIVVDVDCAIQGATSPRAKLLWATIALAFVSLIVSLGSLASLEEACMDDANGGAGYGATRGFASAVLTCEKVLGFSKVYRFYWFLDFIQLSFLFNTAVVLSFNQFRRYKVAILSIFTVTTLLYIEATDAFLTGTEMPRYHVDELQDRAWSKVAGCIMVCISNFLFLIVAALEDEEAKLV